VTVNQNSVALQEITIRYIPSQGMPKNRKYRRAAETLRVAVPEHADASEADRKVASLLVVQGAEVDLGRHMLCDRPITVGRDDRVDLSLMDGSISRAHCTVERDPETGRYVLVDLGSTNGTSINGVRVHDHVPLSEGDKIFLGASVLRFSFSDRLDLEYQSRLEELVTTDALTGLFTKRQYDATYAMMVERAGVEDSVLTVLVMDLDGLKQINDTHGHELGSFAIAEVAGIARSVLEPHGPLARFGGDEFVGCFPGLEHERACELAEEVRRRVADHVLARDGLRLHATLSVGVASYPRDVLDPNELFTAADRAMYKAKRSGKNRVATVDDQATRSSS
jgi:two-component system, cell cycle response regulator